ncbi:E3 ubiquitin-protein ligase MIB2-like isoform X1 [Octopus vulgaris]|uniref:E3 ubiquitin-protein ligase MIB2-like isoform X1 n=1 Tax=Octopus vulgaris TaxID=6645 RepID=A0AA36AWN6_OCTVU|nr:E3 ubiquitin-protein ligase MIB2-like isoform X1 [Octopus vulgaris]
MNWDSDDIVEAFKKFKQKTQLAFKSFLKGTTADEKVNLRNKDGQTPLHLACSRGHFHTVDMLLGHNGIDVNVVDKNGDTPLHEAVQRCRCCHENLATVRLQPCGDLVLCENCSSEMTFKSCPVCREYTLSKSEFAHTGMKVDSVTLGDNVFSINRGPLHNLGGSKLVRRIIRTEEARETVFV